MAIVQSSGTEAEPHVAVQPDDGQALQAATDDVGEVVPVLHRVPCRFDLYGRPCDMVVCESPQAAVQYDTRLWRRDRIC